MVKQKKEAHISHEICASEFDSTNLILMNFITC